MNQSSNKALSAPPKPPLRLHAPFWAIDPPRMILNPDRGKAGQHLMIVDRRREVIWTEEDNDRAD